MYVLLPTELLGTFGLQSLMEEYFIWETVFTISPSVIYVLLQRVHFMWKCLPKLILTLEPVFTVSTNNLQVWSL